MENSGNLRKTPNIREYDSDSDGKGFCQCGVVRLVVKLYPLTDSMEFWNLGKYDGKLFVYKVVGTVRAVQQGRPATHSVTKLIL